MSNLPGDFTTLYASGNPLYRFLTRRFRGAIVQLLPETGADAPLVLDAGCGEGFVYRFLAAANPSLRLFPLDLDAGRAALVKRLNPGAPVTRGNIYQLPFPDSSFDLVLANEILEHLDEPHLALAQIGRVARQYVLCSVPHEPFFALGNLLRGAHWSRMGRTPAHVNFWSRRAFVRLLADHFRVLQVRSVFPWTLALCHVEK